MIFQSYGMIPHSRCQYISDKYTEGTERVQNLPLMITESWHGKTNTVDTAKRTPPSQGRRSSVFLSV